LELALAYFGFPGWLKYIDQKAKKDEHPFWIYSKRLTAFKQQK